MGATLELYRSVENLGLPDLIELADGITKLPPNDPRAWQARNVILTRFAQLDPDGLRYGQVTEHADLERVLPCAQRCLTKAPVAANQDPRSSPT